MHILKKFTQYVRTLPRNYSIGGVVLFIILIILGFHFLKGSSTAATDAIQTSHVTLSSVASLSSATGPLPVTGTVTSLNQATILAQTSGEVVTLNRKLGDKVSAGSIIAQMENSSQQAAVVQAQGAYESAQAALAKAQGTTAANSSISSSQAATGAINAQASVVTSLHSMYAAVDDAIHAKADPLLVNPRSTAPTLIAFTIPDSQAVINIQNGRIGLDTTIANIQTLSDSINSTTINANVATALSNAQTVETFLNTLIAAVNIAVPNQNISAGTIAADQATLAAARSEVIGAISALTSVKSAYDAAQSGSQSAANSAESATSNDVASSRANLKSALGSLQAAQANLEKTIIRSPISGTIVSLPITQGDFVSAFSPAAQVSNPGALEVDAYVTPDDAKTIAVGGKAVINTTTAGVIVSIAPALDPTTGKILVKLGITGDQSQITDGETVTVELSRATGDQTAKPSTTNAPILIPIIAAKITPTGPVVFTISSSTLVAIPITLGTILGDQVTVLTGLTPESTIVTDARGLSNGQTVIVNTQ